MGVWGDGIESSIEDAVEVSPDYMVPGGVITRERVEEVCSLVTFNGCVYGVDSDGRATDDACDGDVSG